MHTPLNLQGKEGRRNSERVKEPKPKRRDQRSCRVLKEGGRGELPKDDRGRQVSGETKESQRREISGTEAKNATEQRPEGTNTEERVQGDHRGTATSARTKDQRGPTPKSVQGDRKGSGKRKNQGIKGDRHRREGPRGSSVESQIKGAIWTKNRRLLRHYQKPIQGAIV